MAMLYYDYKREGARENSKVLMKDWPDFGRTQGHPNMTLLCPVSAGPFSLFSQAA
jgi:hypothetical protein